MKKTVPFVTAIALLAASATAAEPSISRNPDGSVTLDLPAVSPGHSQRVEMAGAGFSRWFPVAAHQEEGGWFWGSDLAVSQFYRLSEERLPNVLEHPTWKRQIELFSVPADPFLSAPAPGGNGEPVRWIKFALRLDDLPEVYFQNTSTYPFHYDFATAHLGPPFAGTDRATFDARSLYHDGREVVLGTVLVAPGANEYAVQFVGQDIFPKEMVRFLYKAVDAKITKPAPAKGFYLPSTEQAAAARGYQPYLEKKGIPLAEAGRWLSGDGCYSPGWALGRLVYVPTAGIEAAYIDGTLRPDDILLTDAVPAEIPSVAGVLSLQPATPNSHVAILARSYGVPFAYLSDPAQQVAVQALAGERVYLHAGSDGWGGRCFTRVVDAESADPALAASITALKAPPALEISPVRTAGRIAYPSLDAVTPDDISTVGGKAANFGFLRRAIPENSPPARAFTFDLWTAYLDQPLPLRGNRTLRQEIARLTGGTTWPPEDMATLDTALEQVRTLIKDEAGFTSAQRTAILGALATPPAFDPTRKIRFRSSTNVEDSASFVGAGLYDSYSGCILDDTDADGEGPSHCDPDQPEERGVFRAIRKVYASFYNLNAYLERLRRGVDESQAGMAVLVHTSFPDAEEAANGVATTLLQPGDPLRFMSGELVSQTGAESVTNPEGGSLPEIVSFDYYLPDTGDPSVTLLKKQRSSRLGGDGETVMVWEDDYRRFTELFFQAASAFKNRKGEPGALTLEFETKKLVDGSLVVKQVRQVPDPTATRDPGHVFLLDDPASWRVFQGERSDVFANHRLKSLWQLTTASRALDPTGLSDSIFGPSRVESVSAPGELHLLEGLPSTWENSTWTQENEFGRDYLAQSWSATVAGTPATLTLDVTVPPDFARRTRPVVTLRDLALQLHGTYSTPQIGLDYEGELVQVTSEVVVLEPGTPARTDRGADRLVTRRATAGNVTIETSYYWPPEPGLSAGYTAPLERWDKTTITGLTDTPIVLTGFFSQTYRPEHHNFGASFLFEPALEEGIPASQRAALAAANIKQVFLRIGGVDPDIRLISFQDTITPVE